MKVTPEATAVENHHLKVWIRVEGTGGAWVKFLAVKVPFGMIDGALPHTLQQWRLDRDEESPPWDTPSLFD